MRRGAAYIARVTGYLAGLVRLSAGPYGSYRSAIRPAVRRGATPQRAPFNHRKAAFLFYSPYISSHRLAYMGHIKVAQHFELYPESSKMEDHQKRKNSGIRCSTAETGVCKLFVNYYKSARHAFFLHLMHLMPALADVRPPQDEGVEPSVCAAAGHLPPRRVFSCVIHA